MSLKIPCPFCKRLIDPEGFPFTCPACNTYHSQFNNFTNCELCRFGPNFIECPNCHQYFELMLLLGSYKNSVGDTYPPNQRIDYSDKLTFTLERLAPGITDNAMNTIKSSFSKEAILKLVDAEFGFPFQIESSMIHTAHKSIDNRYWFHIWAFSTKDEKAKPFGQFTLVFDSRDNTVKSPVREVWYEPGV